MIKNISNLGDAALYCDFGSEVNKEINRNVINYFNNFFVCMGFGSKTIHPPIVSIGEKLRIINL